MLILGGTSEATALAQALARRGDVAATLSFAGRTVSMPAQPLPVRVGGFGGVEGLARYLVTEGVDILVDATHPFATQMSAQAREAAQRVGRLMVQVSRPAWQPQPGDVWREVATMEEAAAAIGAAPRRVFLTIGSLQLAAFAAAPQHFYLVRTIDAVAAHGLAQASFITARGPFDVEAEARLMREHRIEVLVTKNSGAAAAAAKLEAARSLGVPVVMVRRPADDGAAKTVEAALAAIDAHRAGVPRGV